MLAAFDISNTRVTVGLFDGARLSTSFALATDVHRTAEEYAVLLQGLLDQRGLDRAQVDGAAIASVVPPLTGAFEHLCTLLFGVRALVVGVGARTGLRIATHNPREVGPDRVVSALAACHLVQPPVIVVDLDTATAFDLVSADGAYAGTALAPGLAVSAEALVRRTSRLPRVELCAPASAVGKDTVSALQSGLVLGHVALVEGLVARFKRELGADATVIGTGEWAPLIASQSAVLDRVEPALSLLGLRLFYNLNHDHLGHGRSRA